MPMKFPCPNCKQTGLPMFRVVFVRGKSDFKSPVAAKPYACVKCLDIAKLRRGYAFTPPVAEVTSTNHPSMTKEERAKFAATRAQKSTISVPAYKPAK